MLQIPEQIVARLYVRHSLRNTPEGLGFTLQNTLAAEDIAGLKLTRVLIDGRAYDAERILIKTKGGSISLPQLSAKVPFLIEREALTDVIIREVSVPKGRHTVALCGAIGPWREAKASITDDVS